jgi:hypothetical protein
LSGINKESFLPWSRAQTTPQKRITFFTRFKNLTDMTRTYCACCNLRIEGDQKKYKYTEDKSGSAFLGGCIAIDRRIDPTLEYGCQACYLKCTNMVCSRQWQSESFEKPRICLFVSALVHFFLPPDSATLFSVNFYISLFFADSSREMTRDDPDPRREVALLPVITIK